jgi:hypothetical protein
MRKRRIFYLYIFSSLKLIYYSFAGELKVFLEFSDGAEVAERKGKDTGSTTWNLKTSKLCAWTYSQRMSNWSIFSKLKQKEAPSLNKARKPHWTRTRWLKVAFSAATIF